MTPVYFPPITQQTHPNLHTDIIHVLSRSMPPGWYTQAGINERIRMAHAAYWATRIK